MCVLLSFRWVSSTPGLPRCIDAKTEADLHPDVRFDNEKKSDFQHSLQYAYVRNVRSESYVCLNAGALFYRLLD